MPTLHLSPQIKNPPAATSGFSNSLAAQAKEVIENDLHKNLRQFKPFFPNSTAPLRAPPGLALAGGVLMRRPTHPPECGRLRSIGEITAEVVADMKFRRQVERRCRLGAREVGEARRT